jgi:hypothetical protein
LVACDGPGGDELIDTKLILAAAIVIGGGFIGLGLYFGLRRESPPAAPPASTSGAPVTSSFPSGATSAGLDAPPPKTDARAAAHLALEKLKPTFTQKCWTPAIQQTSEPGTSTYTMQVSFDESGREVGRGISELRDQPSRSDVAQCLRQLPLSLKIPATGAAFSTELKLSFP